MEWPRVGVWTGRLGRMPAPAVADTVRAVEALGLRTIWFPESVTKEVFSQAAQILAAGEEVAAASGIANIWARDATAMINGARTLGDTYPGRFVLGIGVSHAPTVARRGTTYERPLAAMEAYLDAMEEAQYFGPEPEQEPPLVLAALGPRMLALAGARSAGAHPYFVPVEHTAAARRVLGPGPLLAPEQAVVLSTDAEEARSMARRHMKGYLALDNYSSNLLRLGWNEADLADGGSDELVDAIVAWGDVAALQGRVAAHLAAGADHVSVQVLNGPPDRFPLAELSRLAPALLEL